MPKPSTYRINWPILAALPVVAGQVYLLAAGPAWVRWTVVLSWGTAILMMALALLAERRGS